MAITPVIILGWFSQRQLVRGLTFGDGATSQIDLGKKVLESGYLRYDLSALPGWF